MKKNISPRLHAFLKTTLAGQVVVNMFSDVPDDIEKSKTIRKVNNVIINFTIKLKTIDNLNPKTLYMKFLRFVLEDTIGEIRALKKVDVITQNHLVNFVTGHCRQRMKKYVFRKRRKITI